MDDKEKQQLGVVLSDSGFSGYLSIHDIIPILDHLYDHFDKSFFVTQIQRFGLPQNQKIKEFYKQRFNDSELTVAMLFLACGPKMTVNEFPDKKYIAEVEDGFILEEIEDEN